ncbi:hypothetical protein [uncultured Sphingomonas sp.]|uniref:hypothetical protein n=1 Tax=uncultured Sphingomonas sp. TaxID=158754 RepID=UPI00374A1FB7
MVLTRVESIVTHLREQARRYERLAQDLETRADGSFLREMATGYLALADRHLAEKMPETRRR